jgi:peptidoglycan/xylan/chitin deacetylase (PgdA/CDA1 family)
MNSDDSTRQCAGAVHDVVPPSPRRVYLLYHEVFSEPRNYTYAIDKTTFRQHLELFANVRNRDGGWLRPEVTFDDGHQSAVEIAAPLLLEFNIAAHFFITVGWTSTRPEYLTWAQLTDLHRAGHKIGAHGWSHTLLTRCTDAQLQVELGRAREMLEDKLGCPITTMSLPGGRMNDRVLDACRRAGYQQIFTSVPRSEASETASLLGRVNMHSDKSTAWLEALLRPGSDQLQRMERQYRFKQTAQRLLGDRLYANLWSILNRADSEATPA